MPWIYNTRAYPVNIRTSDGRMRLVPGKERAYITPELMAPSIGEQCSKGEFANQGGDPEPVKAEAEPLKQDTSSGEQSLDVNITSSSGADSTNNQENAGDGQDTDGDAVGDGSQKPRRRRS